MSSTSVKKRSSNPVADSTRRPPYEKAGVFALRDKAAGGGSDGIGQDRAGSGRIKRTDRPINEQKTDDLDSPAAVRRIYDDPRTLTLDEIDFSDGIYRLRK